VSNLFSTGNLDPELEAAFLLKQTGIPLAAWTRNPVPQEVISVMAATLWGSLDTMIRTLGGTGPRSAVLEVEDRRIFAVLVEPNWTLLLIAPSSMGMRRLRRTARTLLGRVTDTRKNTVGRAATVDVSE
jgi:predicted regulator of Ras-like GTPase activity (Roadblock/LC7/MglB family)